MIEKNYQIEIEPDDVFKNDLLNRKEIIENLSLLITQTTEPLVLSVNGDWGSGKTTFVRLWKAFLENEYNLETIYFSAWEDDFSKDPLLSLLGEINTFLEQLEGDETEKKEEKIKKLKEVGSKILTRALPAMIKGATSGLLDIDRGYESALSALSEEATKKFIEEYETQKAIREEFQEALGEILSLMPDDMPLVIFIDELDRCRPLYAIELLERIKHLFGVERVVFVLSVDKVQLSESIKSQYGNIDTENYLRRFIDLQLDLPDAGIEEFCDFLYKKYRIQEILLSKEIPLEAPLDTISHHLKLLKVLSISFGLSLREIEQLFMKLDILIKTVEKKFYGMHLWLFVLFEILRMKSGELYQRILQNDVEAKEKVKAILEEKMNKYLLSQTSRINYPLIYLNAVIDVSGLNRDEYATYIVKKQEELEQETDSEKSEILTHYIEVLKSDPSYFGMNTLNIQIERVIKKINFIDKFYI